MASHLLDRQVFVSAPKKRRLRNYLYNLVNNPISKGRQSLTGRPSACVPGAEECDLVVSASATSAGHGDKESMGESWNQVPRANRDMESR
jgi:hypothetical protein